MIQRTLLVTDSDDRRKAWEVQLADDRTVFTRCAGPSASCPLLTGATRCPLHDEVDVAIYDRQVVTLDILVALLAKPPAVPIIFARANGMASPTLTHTISHGIVRKAP